MKKLNISCRGKEAKKELLDKYYIKPISFIKLLEGQQKNGCCGKIIDNYYAFEFTDKETKDKGIFLVGYVCGNEFFKMLKINKSKYPLFNPFSKNTLKNKKGIDIVNKEVYDAIHLILIDWNGIPYGDYANIINFIRKKPYYRVSNEVIKKINYLISKDAKSRSLFEIVKDLKSRYRIRDFKFDNIKEISDNLVSAGELDKNYILS